MGLRVCDELNVAKLLGKQSRCQVSTLLLAMALVSWAAPSLAQHAPLPESEPGDSFEMSGRASTNLQLFERALLPGPGGAVVQSYGSLPIHQSLSVRATQVDSPIATDGTEIQVAGFGQLVAGDPQDVETASWDVSSAFIAQRLGALRFAVGRQVVAGGAARYSRLDGGTVSAGLDSGFVVNAYGGWTVLPRWSDRVGYHQLGAAYDEWATDPSVHALPDRRKNLMGGGRLMWAREGLGGLGASIHHQSEDGGVRNQTLGMSGNLTRVKNVELIAEGLFHLEQSRFSDARIVAEWRALNAEEIDTAVTIRGEFLHTVPSLLLSQNSIFSVFSHSQVSEAGGEVSADLPLRFRTSVSGHAQMFEAGDTGMRAHFKLRYAYDDEGTLILRTQVGRVDSKDNGYMMMRAAGRYGFLPGWSLMADAYYYHYDEEIRGHKSSTFYAAHLGYLSLSQWDARLGASVTHSPYAKMDAQLLARFTYEWDSYGGRRR